MSFVALEGARVRGRVWRKNKTNSIIQQNNNINKVMIIIMNKFLSLSTSKTYSMMRGGADNCNANEKKVTNDSKVLFGTHQSVVVTGTVHQVWSVTHHNVGWWPRPWLRRKFLRSSRTCTASSDALLSSPEPTPPQSMRILLVLLHRSCKDGLL